MTPMDLARRELSNATVLPAGEPVDPIVGMTEALAVTFTVIGVGYFLRSRGVMSKTAGQGIGQLIGKVVLPALLFKGMATLDFGDINFAILAAMGLGKLIGFIIAVVFVLLTDSRPNKVSVAGVYATFVTQSNDLAFGFPVISALFPELLPYLYLSVPFQLLVLTPAGFVLMEIGAAAAARDKASKSLLDDEAKGDGGDSAGGEKSASACTTAGKIAKNVLANPIVASTILGLIVGLLTGGKLPVVVTKLFTLMGNAFGMCALFNLGMAIVGKLGVLRGTAAAVPVFLSLIKTLLVPIMMRLLLVAFDPESTSDALSFVYVMGTMPTAPSVFVYATQYAVTPPLIAGASVLCTMMSAPLLYITTVLLSADTPGAFTTAIMNTSSLMGGLGNWGCAWIVLSFMLFPRQRRFPTDLVFYLSLSQMLLGVFHQVCMTQTEDGDVTATGSVAVYTLQEIFRNWQLIWTCILLYNLYLIVKDGAAGRTQGLKNRRWYHPVTWFVAILLAAITAAMGTPDTQFAFPCMYRFGRGHAAIDMSLSIVVLIGVIGLMVQVERASRSSSVQAPNDLTRLGRSRRASMAAGKTADSGGMRSRASAAKKAAADEKPADDEDEDDEVKAPPLGDKFRLQLIGAWVALSLVLKVVIGLSYVTGDDLQSGAILQVLFIEQTLSYGSGLVTFFTFGIQTELLELWSQAYQKMYTWYRRKLFGAQDIGHLISTTNSHPPELLDLLMAISRPSSKLIGNRRYLLRTYKQVFVGSELVDWLVKTRRVTDRTEGERLGRQLVEAGFVQHVTDEHHFEDSGAFYRLVPVEVRPQSLVDLVLRMTSSASGLVADRRWRIRKFEKCMVGSDIVDWMIEESIAADRPAAVKLGQEAVFHHLLEHVTQDHGFHDDELYYRATADAINPLFMAGESGRFV